MLLVDTNDNLKLARNYNLIIYIINLLKDCHIKFLNVVYDTITICHLMISDKVILYSFLLSRFTSS